ncbi:hypothetical protein E3N88_13186 [Mikania micrantha]|uniref:non-specific serine/threonine protein kinase n=1 Tax=Mikania micrantha TaxID=192012 RepID=A0A5N6PA65_9ASTR|nr:hypothetical protein E3N88_13186 [Mikania micrantha]
MEYFSVVDNPFGGRIPHTLGHLKSLKGIYLGVCNLSGTIPDSLYNLSLLTDISLPHNQLTGSIHTAIGVMLPYLVFLQLWGNQLTGPLPPSISNCSKLSYFEVFENKFSGKLTIDFSKLRGIYYINLRDNLFGSNDPDEMKFIDSLKNCTGLMKVEFGNCNFQGVIPWSIGNLSSQLNYLRLYGNQLYGDLPTSIGNLIGLETLSLGGNQFTGNIPSTIGNLQKLEVIDLSNNQLSGQIPNAMGNLSSLTKLDLSSNMLEGVIPSSLGNCQHLLDLYIDDNRLNGKIPTKLLQLSSLSITLNLSKNNLFGSLPTEVGDLKMLTALDLSYNNLSGFIPTSLGDCGSLLRLFLKGNVFQGTIPSSLSSLKGLLELDISNNNLSGQIPNFLELLKLEHLNLSYNDLEGEIPMVGVFANKRAFSVMGNSRLCGGIVELGLPKCKKTKKYAKNLSGTIPDSLYNLSLLTNISLSDNRLTGSLHTTIGRMFPYLAFLQLWGNQLTGPLPSSVSNCSRLIHFEVFENKFSGKLTIDFSKLRDIYYINLRDNLFGSNEPDEMKFIDSLKNCTGLLRLELGNCNFQGVIPWSIGNLSSQLNYLRLYGNHLHGNLPRSIGNLVVLETLDLTGQIPDAMGNLSFLISLYLSSNMLEGVIPSSLGNCHCLLEFYIDDNNLNGKIPTKLLQLSSMSITLNLAKNKLFDSLPTKVGDLKMLSSLDLSYNNLSGVIPISLGDCGSLLWLSLKGNLFQGIIPSSLSSLKGLMELDISNNNLSGKIPKFLGQLRLEHLNLSYNDFEGEVPTLGVFTNKSAFFVMRNNRLCGGIVELGLPKCKKTKKYAKKVWCWK